MRIFISRLTAVLLAAAVFLIPCVAMAKTSDEVTEAEKVYGWFETVPIDIFTGNVAPGTSGEHTFSVRNTSNYALEYKLMFYGADGAVPLRYKIRNEDTYLIGTEDTWEEVKVAAESKTSAGTVPYGGKLDLVIEWEWPYESGADDIDTEVGIDIPEEMFYISVTGTGRDASSAPVIVKSDFVEPAGPYTFPLTTLILGAVSKIAVNKKREEDRYGA